MTHAKPQGRGIVAVSALTHPATIVVISGGVSLFSYFLYVFGLVPSFRILNVSTSPEGILKLSLFWFCLLCGCLLSGTVRVHGDWLSRVKVGKPAKAALCALLAIATFGTLSTLASLGANPADFGKQIVMGLQGRLAQDLEFGQGKTGLFLLVFPCIPILAMWWHELHRAIRLVCAGLIALIVITNSIVLMSRMNVIVAACICVMLLLRARLFNMSLTAKHISMLSLCLLCAISFLVWAGAVRDYDVQGRLYTSSRLEWGLSRLNDYFVSTASYSIDIGSHAVTNPMFPRSTFPLIGRVTGWSPTAPVDLPQKDTRAGAPEYTNEGGFSQFFTDFSYLYPLCALLFGLICARAWQSFALGERYGLVVYPFLAYNLMEMPRLFYLGSIAGAFILTALCFVTAFVGRTRECDMGGR